MPKNLILVLGGIIAGGLAYRAYEFSGLASAIAVVLIAGWIFVNLMTADGIFNALGNLLDPFHTAVNFCFSDFFMRRFRAELSGFQLVRV